MKVKIVLVIFVLSFLLTACAPGVQPLLDDYNALFEVTLRDELLIANKSDWLPTHMEVAKIATLNLSAPKHCDSYLWDLKPRDTSGKIPDNFDIKTPENGGTTQNLHINLQKYGFEEGYYTVSCTVVFDGERITKSCAVNIIEGKR